jgi:hypothetical protein
MPRADTRTQLLSATTNASQPLSKNTSVPFDRSHGALSSKSKISAFAEEQIIKDTNTQKGRHSALIFVIYLFVM